MLLLGDRSYYNIISKVSHTTIAVGTRIFDELGHKIKKTLHGKYYALNKI